MAEEEEIQLLEARLNELRVAYEKYFAGVEKLEPARLRDEVQRMVRKAGTLYISNTGLKFKRDSVIAQFNTLTQHWNRILKQIEDGTYQRDIFRMRLKDKERGIPAVPKPGTGSQPPEQTGKAAVEGRAAPPGKPPAPGASGSPAAKAPPAQSGEYDSVYRSLVAAKKRLGEPTDNISYNALEWSLKKEAEAIKKKFKASRVDFTVEVKDGKPVIKAVPIK